MPTVDFVSSTGSAVSQSRTTATKLIKNLGSPGYIAAQSNASIVGVSRLRSFPEAKAFSEFQSKAEIKLRLNFGAMTIGATSTTEVVGFVNRNTTAIPKGKLLVSNVDPLINRTIAYPPLNGKRLVKGDLTPIQILVEGQKLGDLSGILEVKGRDLATSAVYNFTCSANFAAQSFESQLVERRSGALAIEPYQTNGFPIDKEIPCQYKFVLTDGNGRIYTIETGSFTVYPALI
jgi:hypothetical protein